MMRFKLFILSFLITLTSFATHNRAGYISYTRVGTTGYTYTFRIYTYTNPMSYAADRCTETLLFTNIYNTSQIDSLVCTRINNTPGQDLTSTFLYNNQYTQLANCPNGVGTAQGEMLVYPYVLPGGGSYGGVKVNIYEGTKSFSGPPAGKGYVFGMVDPNLDDNVNNVGGGNGGSQNVAFGLLDTLNFSNGAGLGFNNTPLVTNPPIDNACLHQTFCYNPGMVDPDNDSLSYSLGSFLTGDHKGNFYTAPNSFVPAGIHVNAVTGQLCWTDTINNFSDQAIGEYDIDMIVKEYKRNTIDGSRYLVGTMVFAVQIYVNNCPNINTGVTITLPPAKACIIAGQVYTSPTFTAGEVGSSLNMTASGIAISGTTIGPNAVFSGSTGSANVASGSLSWVPSCEAVHLNPYYVTIQASDNQIPANTNYSTLTMQVIAPPVKNLTDSVKGDSIKLQWDAPATCASNQYNKINSYLIYRVSNCQNYTPGPCQTGVPASSGFVLIGTSTNITAAHPIFYDNNNGQGLPAGNSYSYIVIAKFDDGSLSVACTAVCITLHYGVPIITNVSVDTTDATQGRITVKWQKPIIGALNFDSTKYSGPYSFSLNRLDASGTYTTSIYTSTPQQYFANLKNATDTSYTDVNMDTQSKGYYYKVYFYSSGNQSTGNSAPASSVFASGVGHDKKAVLSWTSQTPWQDTLYYVYKQNNTNLGYTLVGTTHATTDTVYNLNNNHTYCFKILSAGSYLNPNIISPLFNYSQKVCVTPIDDSPPCQPKLNIAGDCDAALNKLTWSNPDHACGINDVLKYYIYYTPTQDSTLTKIDSILNVNDTTYTTNVNTQSIAGCYVVVAVDSAGNQSPLNNESCTDNCPEYELPNIFTPNGDNTNDLYIPVKNRYIRSVDFVLYNRWGEIIFETTTPGLGWDGKSKQMKQPVPDGVYFYTCTVYEIHYNGLKERKLKGFVQILK